MDADTYYLNTHLEYVARAQGRTRADFEEEELNKIAFPDDPAMMIDIFGRSLAHYYERLQPRSRLRNERFSFGEMSRIGDSLLCCVVYTRLKAKKPPISRPDLLSYVAEALRAVQTK
jgi:hypothetical protein